MIVTKPKISTSDSTLNKQTHYLLKKWRNKKFLKSKGKDKHTSFPWNTTCIHKVPTPHKSQGHFIVKKSSSTT